MSLADVLGSLYNFGDIMLKIRYTHPMHILYFVNSTRQNYSYFTMRGNQHQYDFVYADYQTSSCIYYILLITYTIIIFNIAYLLFCLLLSKFYKQLLKSLSKETMARLYDAWPGRNRFLPCGCILGPVGDSCANIYVYCCFISALIPYCIFILPVVWQVSPAIPILFFLSVCFTILFLSLTQCTDPGIIPRRPYLQRKPDIFEKYLLETLPGQQNNPSKKRRFCETCGIYRPPRTSHCSTCNNCVQVFDHHCPFVNNCIGKRNYRFFVLFLAGIMLSMGTLIVNIVIFGIAKAGSKVDSTIVIIVCSVAVGIIGIPLLIFFMFHIFLMITGKTTRQLIKNVNEQEPQQNQNQWCKVDPPIINYFEQVDESTIDLLKNSMQKLFEMKPISNNNNNPKNSDNTKIVNEAEDHSNIVINNQLAEQNQ